jgi:hypothetical protein
MMEQLSQSRLADGSYVRASLSPTKACSSHQPRRLSVHLHFVFATRIQDELLQVRSIAQRLVSTYTLFT